MITQKLEIHNNHTIPPLPKAAIHGKLNSKENSNNFHPLGLWVSIMLTSILHYNSSVEYELQCTKFTTVLTLSLQQFLKWFIFPWNCLSTPYSLAQPECCSIQKRPETARGTLKIQLRKDYVQSISARIGNKIIWQRMHKCSLNDECYSVTVERTVGISVWRYIAP